MVQFQKLTSILRRIPSTTTICVDTIAGGFPNSLTTCLRESVL
jgi:hypothetical protein